MRKIIPSNPRVILYGNCEITNNQSHDNEKGGYKNGNIYVFLCENFVRFIFSGMIH